MRVFIQSPDTWGRIDGTVRANLLNFFTLTSNQSEADVVVVPVSFYDNFIFNESLYKITKPIVICDYLEYGCSWKAGTDTHVLGRNTNNFSNIASEQWMRLDAFVRDHKPAVYFKRELLERERSDWLQPIEFPCYLPAWPAQSKEEFDKRRISIYHVWGMSHFSRPLVHGQLFSNACDDGFGMISSFEQMDHYFAENAHAAIASIFQPHYVRQDISTVMHYQSAAKLSLSLYGNGKKCFRHGEACINSLMVMPEDGIAWSHPWVNGHNCLKPFDGDDGVYNHSDLVALLDRNDLHEIYLEGLATVDKYRSSRYVNEYINPILESVLT